MSITLAKGRASGLKSFQMIHGGAGPADAKGERFEKVAGELQTLIENWLQSSSEELQNWLRNRDPKLNAAEQKALRLALELENHPAFNAGLGASIQADGRARVSASFMESTRQKFSAVMNLENLRNPSLLAAWLQAARFPVLDTRGATQLARDLEIPEETIETPERLERWRQLQSRASSGKYSTIGSLAADALGHLCAVTSTGGVGNETPGRVGDSPTIAGNFCDAKTAVSCTGIGEQITSLGVARALALRVQDGLSLSEAAKKILREADEKKFELAFIAIHQVAIQEWDWVAGSSHAQLLWARIEDQRFILDLDLAIQHF